MKHTRACWVLVSVNGKRKEKISKVRELLWRENEKSLQSANEKSFLINLQVTVTFRKVVTLSEKSLLSKK